MKATQLLEGEPVVRGARLALRINFWNPGVVSSTEIPLLPLPLFTKVRGSSHCRGTFLYPGTEMHGKEDGTMPATFQVIYMVYSFTTTFEQELNAKRTDWVEALSKPAKTS